MHTFERGGIYDHCIDLVKKVEADRVANGGQLVSDGALRELIRVMREHKADPVKYP